MATACLLGNGVSIAYNETLRIPTLTEELLAELKSVSGSNAAASLAAFAHEVAANQDGQFESLLGPLSTTASALDHLEDLSALAQASPEATVRTALADTTGFLREVHRLGLGTVLNLIANKAFGEDGAFNRVTTAMAGGLIDLGPAGDLAVATLNYDGLTHAGLLETGRDDWGNTNYEITDLANGRWGARKGHEIVPGHNLAGLPLRDSDDMPTGRAAVLHLHGFLGWLRDPSIGQVWKFELNDLRGVDYWRKFVRGKTAWEPVVVLTDRKDRATLEWPFRLAYEVFASRLTSSDRWLIAGYGFGDEPVNALYKNASKTRKRLGLPDPRVLVVDVGAPSSKHRRRVRAIRELGLLGDATVNLDGVPAVFESDDWEAFASDE